MNLRALSIVLSLGVIAAAIAAPVHEYRYRNGELKALLTHGEMPQYPFEARRTHQQGQGYFRLYVARDGTVTAAKMLKSTGHQLLDASSLKALKSWRLKPGLRREIDVPVLFLLSPGQIPPATPAQRPPTIVREFRD
jgi:TonB family protein